MHKVLALVAVGVTLVVPARADWLATVWPKTADAKNGNPAITVNADAVIVVLPEAVLAEAQTAGLSVPDTVRRFLARYAPKMCSSVLDMSSAHHELKVELRVQRPTAFDAMDTVTQDAAASALNQTLGRKSTIPRIEQAFVVDKDAVILSIDYVPERIANCVAPPDPIF